MDLLDTLLEVGDRVRITQGSAQGKTGTVEGWEGEKILVRSDATGNVRRFDPKVLAHLPSVNGGVSPSPDLDVVSGVEVVAPPDIGGVSPSDLESVIAVLDRVCTTLRSTALTDCWIESWKRGQGDRHRLHFHASTHRPPEYLPAKDVAEVQRRITNGRKLKALQAAIAILREQDSV